MRRFIQNGPLLPVVPVDACREVLVRLVPILAGRLTVVRCCGYSTDFGRLAPFAGESVLPLVQLASVGVLLILFNTSG